MRYIVLTLLFVPVIVFGQESQTFSLGELAVEYTTVEERNGASYYYHNDALTLSAHDRDGSGSADLWISYTGDVVTLEAHDTDGDGAPDAYFRLQRDGMVAEMYGDNIEQFERPEIVVSDIATAGDSSEEDLVGDLSRITIPGGGFGWGWILILILLGAGGYWYYRKKQEEA